MITASRAFIEQIPAVNGPPSSEDLSLRQMFCDYTAATCLVNLARGADDNEQRLEDYLSLRTHAAQYEQVLQAKRDKLDAAPLEDLTRKLEALLAYDFEAACQLHSWDCLVDIISRAAMCQSTPLYLVMADCILSCDAPTHGQLA